LKKKLCGFGNPFQFLLPAFAGIYSFFHRLVSGAPAYKWY